MQQPDYMQRWTSDISSAYNAGYSLIEQLVITDRRNFSWKVVEFPESACQEWLGGRFCGIIVDIRLVMVINAIGNVLWLE